ncbi:MAG: hypothetical protein ACFFDN_14420, partial [Candidatus Hodarchaeota archaeon]
MSPSTSIGNRWKIIFYSTLFNFLFEYAVRGFNNILEIPILFFGIIGIYFTYFILLEELIVRFRLKDYELFFIAFFYCLIGMVFNSGYLFLEPGPFQQNYLIFGVNYLVIIFVCTFWWSEFQTVLTFYFANRITPRDWDQPFLGRKGWILTLFVNGLLLSLFFLCGKIIYGTLEGYISMFILWVVCGFICYKMLKNKDRNEQHIFESSKFLDIIMISTIILSIFCATFLINDPVVIGASHVNSL